MKVGIKSGLSVILVCSFWCLMAHQFIIKKEPAKKQAKEPSRSQLQEMCCHEIGELLRELSSLLKQIAEVQQVGLQQVCDFLEGNEKALLKKSNKEDLSAVHKKVIDMSRYTQEVTTTIARQIQELQALEKKVLNADVKDKVII